MPRTKIRANRTNRKAAYTGPGTARTTPSALGRNASTVINAPAATPTPRAATPVSSIVGTLTVVVWVGMIPAAPHNSLLIPSAATAPCTTR